MEFDNSSTHQSTSLERRRWLKYGLGLCAGLAISPGLLAAQIKPGCQPVGERQLKFYNLHTGEKLQTVYWAEGNYIDCSLKDINHILRDFRRNEEIAMDKNLLDLLFVLQNQLQTQGTIQIISGYRSPQTNAMLRGKSKGVAKKSFHMRGQAIDINIKGVNLKDLHKAALALKGGGVGYYPRSGFIHIDTGPVRRWG